MERKQQQMSPMNRNQHVSIYFRSKNSVLLTMDKLIEQIKLGNSIQNNINTLINTYLNSTNPNNRFPLTETYKSHYFMEIVMILKNMAQISRENGNIFNEIKWLEKMKRIGYRGGVDENNTNVSEKLGHLYKCLGDKEYSKTKPTDTNWPKIQPIVIGYYEKATNNGNNEAKMTLSSLYEELGSMEYNKIKNLRFDFERRSAQQGALGYFKKAYELGNPNVSYKIGLLYERMGDECKNIGDCDSATCYYGDAIKFGNSNAEGKLANIYNINGYEVLKKKRLVQNDKIVLGQMNRTISCYNNEGHKVQISVNTSVINEAIYWFKKSAELGNDIGLNNFTVLQGERNNFNQPEVLVNNLIEANNSNNVIARENLIELRNRLKRRGIDIDNSKEKVESLINQQSQQQNQPSKLPSLNK